MTFRVIKSLTPFTKARLYLVHLDTHANLPSQLILKAYDPRFFNEERYPNVPWIPIRPWTLDAEYEATKRRVSAGEVEDDFDIVDRLYGDERHEPWLWEEYYFRLSTRCFESEFEACKRLVEVQGRSITKFYGYERYS